MNFLSRGYSALVGEGRSHQQDPEQTIQKLVDRVYASTLIEDKRAAILGLKGLSREYKPIVGKEALKALLDTLQEEAEDPNMIKAILETLNNLIIPDNNDEPQELSNLYAREVVESDNHVSKLLELIGDADFYVRYSALQQLGILFSQLSELLLSKVLTSPTGVGRLVDLLNDSREIVRNEGVHLLILMTERNTEIQKILAFENSFEKLFNIVVEEGGVGGNIIVQDCLQLLYNLLSYNISNQKYFRETNCIQKLPDLIGFEPTANELSGYSSESSLWREQQIENMIIILRIIRMLVQPDNVDTSVNQKVMQQCGMVSPLLQLSLSIEAPCAIRGLALCAIGDIIQSNQQNQSLFQRILITAQTEDDFDDDDHGNETQGRGSSVQRNVPEPAVLVITRLAVAARPNSIPEEEYGIVRNAAAYLVKSYLKENPDARISIAATFRPPPTDDLLENSEFNHSVGSLLISVMTLPLEGLYPIQAVRIWHAISLFSSLLSGDDICKQLALKTLVDEFNGSTGVPLISALTSQTILSSKMLEMNGGSGERQVSGFSQSGKDNFLCVQFLAMLCIWASNSPESVSSLLESKELVTFLLETIGEQDHKKSIRCGVASFLFGVFYEFNTESNTPMSFDELYMFISKRIGIDSLVLNLTRLNDSQEIHTAFSNNYDELVILGFDSVPIRFDSSFANLLRYHINQTKSFLRKTPDSIKKHHESEKATTNKKATKAKRKNSKSSVKDKKSENGDADQSKLHESMKEIEELRNAKTKLEDSLANLTLESKDSEENVKNLKEELERSQSIWEEKLKAFQFQLNSANQRISELEGINTKLKEAAEKTPVIQAASDSSFVEDLQSKLAAIEREQEDLLTLLADQDALCRDYRTQLRNLGQEIPPSDSED